MSNDTEFQVGRTYWTRSMGDYDAIFRYTVTRRSAATVWLKDCAGAREGRRLIFDCDGIEHCRPEGSYSMAPIIRANRFEEGPEVLITDPGDTVQAVDTPKDSMPAASPTPRFEAVQRMRDDIAHLAAQNLGESCLGHMCCPHCGNAQAFTIEVQGYVIVYPGGVETGEGDNEWGPDRAASCHRCGHNDTVGYFEDARNVAIVAARAAINTDLESFVPALAAIAMERFDNED